MAEFSAAGLLRSGSRLKRQAQVRNEHLFRLVEWCLTEVQSLPGKASMHWNEHSHTVRGSLAAFMSESRGAVVSEVGTSGAAATQAIEAILSAADTNAQAELDEFEAGVWRPRMPSMGTSVTNNNLTVSNSTVGNIQQAGDHAYQQGTSAMSIDATRQALDAFDHAVFQADLSEQIKDALRAEIETIRPQLKKDTPNATILRESLKTLRNVVEGIAAGAVTPAFLVLLQAATPLIGVAGLG